MTEHMVKHNRNRDGIRLHHKNVSESDYKSHQKNATTIAMRDVRTSKTANLHKTSYVRSITAYAHTEVRLNRSMDVVHVHRSRSKKVAPETCPKQLCGICTYQQNNEPEKGFKCQEHLHANRLGSNGVLMILTCGDQCRQFGSNFTGGTFTPTFFCGEY